MSLYSVLLLLTSFFLTDSVLCYYKEVYMKVDYKKLTINEMWNQSRNLFAQDPFLGYAGEDALTYKEVSTNIEALQAYLQSIGIQKGDRVALVAESSPFWGQVYLAVVTMGAVIVPIMVEFGAEQLQNVIEHSESSFLFASKKVISKIENLTIVEKNQFAIIESDAIYKDEVNLFDTTPQDLFYDAEEGDVAAILYTSGTTGNSKGVMLSQFNIAHNAHCGVTIGGLAKSTPYRFLSVLPLAHSYECSLGFILPMASGASISYLRGAPTASKMLPALQKVHPTHMLTVPLLMEKIYRSSILPNIQKSPVLRGLYKFPPVRKLLNRFVIGKKMTKLFGGSLEFFGVGGAPLAPDVEKFLREAKFPYSVGYGLTETSPCIAGNPVSESVFRGIGRSFDQVDIRVAEPEGNNMDGEVQARGASIMLGYYKDEERTKAAFTSDGWFKTGDLGHIDKHGNLFIRGRLKSMILGSNGKNIYPEEIEALLNRNAFIEESLVVMAKGKLIARVQLRQEQVEKAFAGIKDKEMLQKKQDEILDTIKTSVNSKLSMISRLSDLVVEKTPFEKTPSMKIKRFLYTSE